MNLRSCLAGVSMWLGLPADVAAGLPRIELDGFRACSIDQHTGILEYSREQIVVGLNIGRVQICGHGLEIRLMHRDRLTIAGHITSLSYMEGGLAGCGR